MYNGHDQVPLLVCPNGDVMSVSAPLHLALPRSTGTLASREDHLLLSFGAALKGGKHAEALALHEQITQSHTQLQVFFCYRARIFRRRTVRSKKKF